ncbi:hypothetical protein P154DRAFT_598294 [Amniculicola lignicola CBS 123094]|uniref:Uncharacterized protein n=1 Tax=Amniculicola lignicola CBS 123094 TaxID=1392246 RepID=A0A6A5WFN5_9PLEO|nr:hypothetical protein P154DRAFT_598294 [Amniculicola lignicola CBS 123094]
MKLRSGGRGYITPVTTRQCARAATDIKYGECWVSRISLWPRSKSLSDAWTCAEHGSQSTVKDAHVLPLHPAGNRWSQSARQIPIPPKATPAHGATAQATNPARRPPRKSAPIGGPVLERMAPEKNGGEVPRCLLSPCAASRRGEQASTTAALTDLWALTASCKGSSGSTPARLQKACHGSTAWLCTNSPSHPKDAQQGENPQIAAQVIHREVLCEFAGFHQTNVPYRILGPCREPCGAFPSRSASVPEMLHDMVIKSLFFCSSVRVRVGLGCVDEGNQSHRWPPPSSRGFIFRTPPEDRRHRKETHVRHTGHCCAWFIFAQSTKFKPGVGVWPS